MTKLRKLKEEARRAATWRGHDLGNFRTVREGVATADCRRCGLGVTVHADPAPNGIDTHGPAVALNCGDEERS